MTTESKFDRPLSTVITVPDPDNLLVTSRAEQGGILQWRTDTHRFPKFEIRFEGPNPSNKKMNLVLEGSDVKPVVIRLKIIGDYKYNIRHIGKNKSVDTGPFAASVHSCQGCPPVPPGF
jgi:hypothetical protein